MDSLDRNNHWKKYLRKLEKELKRLLMDLGQWEGIGQSGIHSVELEGFRVPRIVVQEIIRELDP